MRPRDRMQALLAVLLALAVAAAAFVKGAIGFGFPTLGTPLLTLLVDVKTAFLVLIVPNIVMDALQFVRAGARRASHPPHGAASSCSAPSARWSAPVCWPRSPPAPSC